MNNQLNPRKRMRIAKIAVAVNIVLIAGSLSLAIINITTARHELLAAMNLATVIICTASLILNIKTHRTWKKIWHDHSS